MAPVLDSSHNCPKATVLLSSLYFFIYLTQYFACLFVIIIKGNSKMDRKRLFRWLGVLLAVLVVGACSKEEDHEYTKSLEDSFKYYGQNGNYNGVANDGFRTEAGYTGVWSMDDVIVDSADVYFAANGGMYYLDFLWFPYKAITKKIAPDVNVAKIKFLIDDGSHLESQEDQMLADLHNRLGINKETTFPGKYPSNFLRLL